MNESIRILRERDHVDLVRGLENRRTKARQRVDPAEAEKINVRYGIRMHQILRDSIVYLVEQNERMEREFLRAIAEVRSVHQEILAAKERSLNGHRLKLDLIRISKRVEKLEKQERG